MGLRGVLASLTSLMALTRPCVREFASFVDLHNKVYNTTEYHHRQAVFCDNYEAIVAHNANAARSFHMAVNEYADLTDDEFLRGRSKHTARAARAETHPEGHPEGYTPIRDWELEGAMPPVKNQGSCGSCYAFAAVTAIEAHRSALRAKNSTADLLSIGQVIDCSRPQGNSRCDGGYAQNVFLYAMAEGLCRASVYPYAIHEQACQVDTRDVIRRRRRHTTRPWTGPGVCGAPVRCPERVYIRDYVSLPPGDEAAMERTVRHHGVLAVSVDASSPKLRFYHSGVFDACANDPDLDHAVVVSGFGYIGATPVWRIRNSWGAAWGAGGSYFIPRGNNTCGVAMDTCYPLV